MTTFRLRTVPGSFWPPVCDSRVSQVWGAYLELGRTQWYEPEKLEACQLLQARALVAHAMTHVPYYRDVLRAAGIRPGGFTTMADFRRIPVLPRRTVQERGAELVAEQLPDGTQATRSPQTSGSSGAPTTVHQTNVVELWWHACHLRDLEWCDTDTTGTLAAIRSTGQRGEQLAPLLEGVQVPSWRSSLDMLLDTGKAYVMDIASDPRKQLAWLREIAPDYLISYPANLEVLAALIAESSEGPIPSLRDVRSISDTLTAEARAAITAGFGVRVNDTYSCTEAGYLASPCPAGHGLHVHAENVILEVVDADGNPCAPGQSGRVLITALHNFRGPFIRYDVGDTVTLGAARCPCGRGLPLLARVDGKLSPMFVLGGGKQKGSTRLAYALRKIGGHWQHQVVHTAADRVHVRVVPDRQWTAEHGERMRAAVIEFFEQPMHVELEVCERMPMPENGKFQNMVAQVRG